MNRIKIFSNGFIINLSIRIINFETLKYLENLLKDRVVGDEGEESF